MIEITFNAFATMQKELKQKNIECTNARLSIESDLSAKAFLKSLGYLVTDIEVVLINGRVKSFDSVLKNGDRVAFIPRFTRGLAGFKTMMDQSF